MPPTPATITSGMATTRLRVKTERLSVLDEPTSEAVTSIVPPSEVSELETANVVLLSPWAIVTWSGTVAIRLSEPEISM